MDAQKMLDELYEERRRIDEAIAALERLGANLVRSRRGRPPKWLAEARKAENGKEKAN